MDVLRQGQIKGEITILYGGSPMYELAHVQQKEPIVETETTPKGHHQLAVAKESMQQEMTIPDDNQHFSPAVTIESLSTRIAQLEAELKLSHNERDEDRQMYNRIIVELQKKVSEYEDTIVQFAEITKHISSVQI